MFRIDYAFARMQAWRWMFGLAVVPAAIFGAQVALRTSRRSLSLAYGFGLATMGGGLLALAH